MYAIGSRQELEALVHHLENNHRILFGMLKDPSADPEDILDILEIVGHGLLFCSMLRDAIRDHFAGKN